MSSSWNSMSSMPEMPPLSVLASSYLSDDGGRSIQEGQFSADDTFADADQMASHATQYSSMYGTYVVTDSDSDDEDDEKGWLSYLRRVGDKSVIRRKLIRNFWRVYDQKFLFVLLFVLFVVLTYFGVFWWNISTNGWITLATASLMLVVLVGELAHTTLVFLFGTAVMVAADIISIQSAFQGFSDTSVVAIALLYIIAKGIEKSGLLDFVVTYVMRRPSNLFSALLRLCIPVFFVSAFFSNTSLTAMMIPVVESWCRLCGIPPQQLLLPLSFAAILGGINTQIGTSVNLITTALATSPDPDQDGDKHKTISIGFFEMAYVGLPVTVLGLLYILTCGMCLLPKGKSLLSLFKRKGVESHGEEEPGESHALLDERGRTYYTTVVVGESRAFDTVETALSGVPGAQVLLLHRHGEVVRMPSLAALGGTAVETGDILEITCPPCSVRQLFERRGLEHMARQQMKGIRDRKLIEAVVASDSPLVGKAVSSKAFIRTYDAALLAINRHGKNVECIHNSHFKSGDGLLLIGSNEFLKHYRNHCDFVLVSEVGHDIKRPHTPIKALFALVCLLLLIGLSASKVTTLTEAALYVVVAMMTLRLISVEEGLRAVSLKTVSIVALAFAVANGLQETGALTDISKMITNATAPGGDLALLYVVFVITSLLSCTIGPTASATLIIPLAWRIHEHRKIAAKAMVFDVMIAASCAFLTPFSYQTNLMVAGTGGYTFMDFFKFGFPLWLIMVACTPPLCWLVYTGDDCTGYASSAFCPTPPNSTLYAS